MLRIQILIAALTFLADVHHVDAKPVLYAMSDPDTEIAQRRFQRGATLYAEGRYEEAIVEFKAARVVKPLPALDYNIARCLDRLERWSDAIKNYEAYLSTLAPGPESSEINARVLMLRQRLAPQRAVAVASLSLPTPAPTPAVVRFTEPAPKPVSVPIIKRWYVWAGVSAVVVAAVAVGVGVGMSGQSKDSSSEGYAVRF